MSRAWSRRGSNLRLALILGAFALLSYGGIYVFYLVRS